MLYNVMMDTKVQNTHTHTYYFQYYTYLERILLYRIYPQATPNQLCEMFSL